MGGRLALWRAIHALGFSSTRRMVSTWVVGGDLYRRMGNLRQSADSAYSTAESHGQTFLR
jgi:hypothetical protein